MGRLAVENMVAMLADGAPLQQLLSQAWPDAAVRMTDALVNGVALGWNPRKTARAMREGLQQGALQRCLTIARTEQLRVYRQATLESYRASGVVRGYKRLAAKQARTCISCLIADGRFYSLDEEFDEHPNGRCTLVPVVIGVDETTWENGQVWLGKQPESVQKQVMGQARWELWKSGQVSLDEMVERHEHPVWGGSLGVRPVSLLPGGAAALRKVYEEAAVTSRSRTAALIHSIWGERRSPTSRELSQIVGEIARSDFNTNIVPVPVKYRGSVYRDIVLGEKANSFDLHLVQRVVVDRQWIDGTDRQQWLSDLHTAVQDTEARVAIYERRGGLVVGVLAPNRVPAKRLGDSADPFIYVVYAVNRGKIVSGYQVSGLETVSISPEALWIK